MPQLFVSYTREAGPSDARRLASDLQSQLGSDQVFGVADEQQAGQKVDEQLGRAEVLVAVIGPGWGGAEDAFAREVGAALSRRIPVIPVLTHDAAMPSRDSLPDHLKPLLDHHPGLTVEIPSDFYWEVSTTRLARWLIKIDAERRGQLKLGQDATANRRKLEQELDRTRRQVSEAEVAVRDWAARRAQLDRAVQSASDTLAQRQRDIDPGRAGGGVRVFVSYGSETSGDARKLESDLKERLERAVVYSTERVPEGAEASAVIGERIARCDVLVAVIGQEWLATRDGATAGGVAEPRLEVQEALRRGLPVFPVLTQHAAKPDRDSLPKGLEPLADRPALELLVQFWSDGVDELVARLRETEQELQRREKATEDAAEQLRGLQREANKARDSHDKSIAGLERGRTKAAELEKRLTRAREDEERLGQEHDDQNRAFLDGPPAIDPESDAQQPSRLLVGAIIAIVVLVIIIVVAAH